MPISITVTFNDKLGKENSKELFSDYLLQKMEHGRICIHEMNRQLHERFTKRSTKSDKVL